MSGAHPSDVPSFEVDATSETALDAIAQDLLKDLAGLVCLAGFMQETRPLGETPTDAWNEVIAGNLSCYQNLGTEARGWGCDCSDRIGLGP